MKTFVVILAALGGAVAIATGLAYAGLYDVAADHPHWSITERFIATARERSIARQSRGAGNAPALDDPALISMGAEHYAEMCVGCHLAPGAEETEIRAGLDPKPPRFADPGGRRSPEEDFWVIKHGIRMTAMPAWGTTHDDHMVWAMVAFLQKLPGLSRADYDALVAKSGSEGHSHEEGDDEHGHDEASEPAHGHSHEDADHHHGG
jgi:mono/diheme cytochrome c family protein